MGTRSLTRIWDNHKREGKPLVVIYRQSDGYLEGHGQQLAELANRKLLNGFQEQTSATHANGMGCLAASIVAGLKKGIGGIYLYSDYDLQEYNYDIYPSEDEKEVMMKVESDDEILFTGTVSLFLRGNVGN